MGKKVVLAIVIFSFCAIGYAAEVKAPARDEQLAGYYKGLLDRRGQIQATLVQVEQELLRTEGRIREREEMKKEGGKGKA